MKLVVYKDGSVWKSLWIICTTIFSAATIDFIFFNNNGFWALYIYAITGMTYAFSQIVGFEE